MAVENLDEVHVVVASDEDDFGRVLDDLGERSIRRLIQPTA